MGISHEYDHARRRSRQRSRYGKLKALGAAAAILLLSAAITAILETARQETAPALPEALPAGTVEGILYHGKPIFTVQFHPEANAGPRDTAFLFDKFLKMAAEGRYDD